MSNSSDRPAGAGRGSQLFRDLQDKMRKMRVTKVPGMLRQERPGGTVFKPVETRKPQQTTGTGDDGVWI